MDGLYRRARAVHKRAPPGPAPGARAHNLAAAAPDHACAGQRKLQGERDQVQGSKYTLGLDKTCYGTVNASVGQCNLLR